MALSMDEQRMLDEMERKLAGDDPLLASRLSSFGHPGLVALLRSPRIRLVAASAALLAIAVVSVLVYALGPFRASTVRHSPGRSAASHSAASHGVSRQATTPARPGTMAGTSGSLAP
jgi:hypothetical protein